MNASLTVVDSRNSSFYAEVIDGQYAMWRIYTMARSTLNYSISVWIKEGSN